MQIIETKTWNKHTHTHTHTKGMETNEINKGKYNKTHLKK
jgi:hypothetical protein